MEKNNNDSSKLMPCFSSANRHSHYNRQKILFERNINHLHIHKDPKISKHVQMIADMFISLSQSDKGKENRSSV